MKKSNKVLLVALAAVFIFSIAFQLKVNRYLRSSEPKKEILQKISEERMVSNFDKISVSQGIEVYFTQDSITQIKIEGFKNNIEHILTDVKNGELLITQHKQSKNFGISKIFVTNTELTELKVASEAYFETMGEVTGEHLILEFGSDTKANLELSYNSVICKAFSGSQVKFKGNTSNIEFTN